MRIFFHLFLMDLKDSHLGPPSCHTELLLSHFPEGSRSDPYQGWQMPFYPCSVKTREVLGLPKPE